MQDINSVYVNPNLSFLLPLLFPSGAHSFFSKFVSLCLLFKQDHLYHFYRLHIYALICDICFFFILIYFILYDILLVHPCLCRWPNFVPLLWLSNSPVCDEREKKGTVQLASSNLPFPFCQKLIPKQHDNFIFLTAVLLLRLFHPFHLTKLWCDSILMTYITQHMLIFQVLSTRHQRCKDA